MIYISLTTVPIRLRLWNLVKQNLDSLLNQKTSKDYNVILNIPYHYKMNNDEEYVLPINNTEHIKNVLDEIKKSNRYE